MSRELDDKPLDELEVIVPNLNWRYSGGTAANPPWTRARKHFRIARAAFPRAGSGVGSTALCRHSKPFFLRISAALFLSTSMVGSVMTGGIFSPFKSLTAWRRPSAPGVA